MIQKLTIILILLSVGALIREAGPASARASVAIAPSDTVHVAPPTSEKETDRASIQAALEQVEPGGTVQFAPGTYHVGQVVRSDIPRLILLGHPEGTVLRGCDPAVLDDLVGQVAEAIALHERGGRPEPPNTDICGLLHLFEGGQTVRGLTFEHSWWGLMLGWHHDGDRRPATEGGHRIEGNTFRHSANGVRATSSSSIVSVIRDNTFVNLRFAVSVLGSGVHLVDNDFTVPEPERPLLRGRDLAIRFAAERHPDLTSCEDNVIAGNRITGYAGGIALYSDPGTSCRNNVIRRNTIALRQVDTASSDPGLPISLDVRRAREAGTADGLIESTLVEENRVISADGPGIVVSRGSVRNRILDNTFDDVAGPAVVLEADRNTVRVRSADDIVQDLGTGNRGSAPGRASDQADGSAFVRLRVQDAEVPRTRTLPGIENPAFPYAQPEEVGLSTEKLNRLGDEITERVENGDLVGGELLIIKDGRAVFHEAYGWSDREERRPMERGSIFSIKSMTKPFVATAVLMLAEEGRLSLDDRVSRYITTYVGDERTTVRHLLAHTSGFEGLGGAINDYASFRAWVEGWAAEGPTRPFGEFSYSDFNYAALGHIIEAASGVSADVFLRERIIGPLGLDETHTAFDTDAPWAARASSRYRWNEEVGDYERYWTRRERQEWDHFPAAWGLWATAMDYAEFLAMWLNGGHYNGVRLLSEETVEEALSPHGLTDGNAVYGYGWFVETPEEADALPFAFGHGGIDGTLARAFPADDAVVILLTHSRYPGNLSAFENRLAMLGLLQYPGPGMVWADGAGVDAVALPPDKRVPYLGIYRGRFPWMEEEVVVRVWEEGDRLHYRLGAIGQRLGPRQHLVPLGDDRFALGRYQGERLVAVDPHVRLHFVVEGSAAEALHVGTGDEVHLTAQRADADQHRADMDRILAEREALRSRTPIDQIIFAALETEGTEAAQAVHGNLLASRPDSVRFGESLLNTLGYRLLREGRTEEAIAVFEMNVEAYPNAANPYDSLADAYRAAGRLEDARRNYERAVELAEEQGHENLEAYRSRLERVTQQLEEQQR